MTLRARWFARSLLVASLAAPPTACEETVPPPTAPPPTPEASFDASAPRTSTTTARLDAVPVFEVALDVDGVLKPGLPFTLVAEVTGNLPAPTAEVRLALPEATVARSLEPRKFRLPLDPPIPPEAERRISLARGQTARLSTTLEIPEPGYYRVVVGAVDNATPNQAFLRESGGRGVQPLARVERWLLVKEEGGRVTDDFDPEFVPDSMRPQPGPFRPIHLSATSSPTTGDITRNLKSTDLKAASVGLAIAKAVRHVASWSGLRERVPYTGAVEVASCDDAGCPYRYQVVYDDSVGGVIRPVAGAEVFIRHLPDFDSPDDGEEIIDQTKISDAEGRFTVDCFADHDSFTATVRARDVDVLVVGPTVVGQDAGDYTDCSNGTNLDRQMIGDTEPSHVFRLMRDAVPDTRALMNRSRERIRVRLANNAGSFYRPSGDSIVLDAAGTDADIYGSRGRFVIPHEYGHAFHARALVGLNPGWDTCPDTGHFVREPSSYGCALSEGFADWTGVVAGGATADWHGVIRNREIPKVADFDSSDPYEPAEIEGAVAAFLFDIEDGLAEVHDSVAHPGTYIADIMDSCRAFFGSLATRASGLDHIVYCFEKGVRSEVTSHTDPEFFSGRAIPDGIEEQATEPSDWDLSELRSLWLHDVYDFNGTRPLGSGGGGGFEEPCEPEPPQFQCEG